MIASLAVLKEKFEMMDIEYKIYRYFVPIFVNPGFFLMIVLMPLKSTAQTYDPWREINQNIYEFNDYFDQLLVKPIASTYSFFVPSVLRQGVGNFFSNVRDVNIAANDLLQLKFHYALQDFGRVIINTSVGIGGLIDVASNLGLEKHEEDFGQTLGFWGVSSGPYMILPVFGASNLRDSLGLILDTLLNPLQYLDDSSMKISLFAVEEIHSRSALLALDELVGGDRYLFIREAYSQNREYLVNDGEVVDPFGSF